MSKKFYCAKCGLKLKVIQKANPQQGTVMNLVIPHECQVAEVSNSKVVDDIKNESTDKNILQKEASAKESGKRVDELFKEFPFVSKLNKVTAEHETVTAAQKPGDKRGKEHLRNELATSSAPLSVLNMATRSNTPPVHELEEPEGI